MKDLLNIIMLTAAFTLLKPAAFLLAGPFYVVVGTFSSESGAREFSYSLDSVFEDAAYRFDPGKKLYYVHVMETGRQSEAENFRNHLQDDFGFRDAWIYTNLNAGEPDAGGGINDGYVKLELFTGGSVLLSSADNSYVSISKHRDQSKESREMAAEKPFMFIAETRLGTVIPAKISLLDRKGNVISAFKTGEAVAVGGKQQTQMLTLVCEVPGFHPVTKIIELADPATFDIHQNSDGIWEVRFTLPKLKADEVALVYGHMFYSDAAILEPAAGKNIDVLVSVLKGNPATRIIINSHCNAGEKRAIKVPARGENYFDLDGAVEKSGSDKYLTRERAEVLRDYLVEQGIESNRVFIFGWGSMNLIVNSAADNKSVNDRVEVQLIGG